MGRMKRKRDFAEREGRGRLKRNGTLILGF